MKRTFNYTNRKKIERGHAKITLRTEGDSFAFDASLNLANYQFPRKAAVYVEAYRENQWMCFNYGTVEKITPPISRKLTEFHSPDGLKFRVRVVMESEKHKLVGEADRLSFVKAGSEEDKRRHIIEPIGSPSLGDLLWKLEMDEDVPRLLVNSRALPTWKDFARSPLFLALVYPDVLRQVLTKIVILEKFEEDDDGGWQQDWIKFAKALSNPGMLTDMNEDEKKEWIETVVSNFAIRHQIKALADSAMEGETS